MVYIRLILTLLFASAVSDLALSTSTSDTISFLLFPSFQKNIKHYITIK